MHSLSLGSLICLFANPLSGLVLHASPNLAVLLATLGVCLIVVELNRPGLILPGFFGLTLFLLALAMLVRAPLRPSALALLGLAFATFACNLWRKLPLALLILASAAVPVGLRLLIPGGVTQGVSLPVALLCGGAIGIPAALLSRVAFRARRLKAVH